MYEKAVMKTCQAKIHSYTVYSPVVVIDQVVHDKAKCIHNIKDKKYDVYQCIACISQSELQDLEKGIGTFFVLFSSGLVGI